MGHFAKSRTLRTSAVAGLAIALASPFARAADALPGAAGGDATAPAFTLSVVHQFPSALQTTPKYLALSKDGNLYGATSAVGSSNGTVFRLSGGTAYTTLATLDYARDGGPYGAPFLGTGGLLYGLTFDGGRTGIGSVYVGGIGKLLISRTIFGLRANCSSSTLAVVTCPGSVPGGLDFDPIIINSDLNVSRQAVVSVQHSVRNNFVQCFVRVADFFKPLLSQLFYTFNNVLCGSHRLFDQIVYWSFYREGCERHRLPVDTLIVCSELKDFDSRSLGQKRLRLISEKHSCSDGGLFIVQK